MKKQNLQKPLIPIATNLVFPQAVNEVVSAYLPVHELSSVIASHENQCILLLTRNSLPTQKTVLEFKKEDVYEVGLLVDVLTHSENSNGYALLTVEGKSRVKLTDLMPNGDSMLGTFDYLDDSLQESFIDATELVSFVTSHSLFLPDSFSEEVIPLLDPKNPIFSMDLIAAHLPISDYDKQTLLEESNLNRRLALCFEYVKNETNAQQMDGQIDVIVQNNLEQERKEQLLKAKLRAISKELNLESKEIEIDNYTERLEKLNLHHHAHDEIQKEIYKLECTSEQSSEAGLIRAYLNFILALPWNHKVSDTLSIASVKEILDERHYGLSDVKERILEYIAVKKLSQSPSSNVLCLLGAPGVGKTSIVRSVAKALNRPFCRIALGGVKDEADFRGHRRTYVGALPGKLVSAIHKSNCMNPVILLDEVDKMGSHFSGDPSSVLLEILDPEQNHAFVDHYLQVPLNLSDVFFVCTANDESKIPPALFNRLEKISILGYTLHEKSELAKQYLIPHLSDSHGLSSEDVVFPDSSIHTMIAKYTSDVGVRGLDRLIRTILRKVALKKASGSLETFTLTEANLLDYLGPGLPKPNFSNTPQVGRSVCVYSEGTIGNILPIEAVLFPGSGKNIATGNIDPLLKESIETAISYLKKHHEDFGLPDHFLQDQDIHIHFHKPELFKQGEGWGLAIFAALLSALLQKPLPANLGFSGQISLLGKVLPTHDVEQKLLSASQLGMETIVISAWNLDDKTLFIPNELTVISILSLTELLDVFKQYE